MKKIKANLKYILVGIFIVTCSVVAILLYNDTITQTSPIYYKQGVDFYNKGDYQNAYYNFLKVSKLSNYYSMAVFKQAKSAHKIGDFSTAIEKYNLFLAQNQSSIFAASARFNLAKCYYSLKKYEEAKELFEEVKVKDAESSAVADYYLGVINSKNDKEEAINNFRSYLMAGENTDRNYELSAAEEFATINDNLSAEDSILLGEIYFKNKKYDKAINYLSKVPLNKSWEYLVLANHYANNKIIAKKLIESGLVPYSFEAKKENLHKIYDVYASYMIGRKLNNWTALYNYVQKKGLSGEDYVAYKLAQISSKERANALYNRINTMYPNSDYAPEAVWNLFWNKYSKRDYRGARELAYQHLNRFKDVKSTPRIDFWLAKTEEKLNQQIEANNIFNRLITKYPDDYYGLRADYIVNKKGNFWAVDDDGMLPEEKEVEFPLTLSNVEIKDTKLINSLFKMGDYDIWLNANFDNDIVESWFELRRNRHALSAILARDAIKEMSVKPPMISSAYKLAYPLHYVEEINTAATKLKLSPFYLISIIKEESHFNPEAKSSTNAMGLMQVMPATANYIAAKLYIPLYSLSNLNDVKTNIYIGSNYIKYLNEKFKNYILITASYNAGEGAVARWLKTYSISDYDEFIENIPYEETKNYVKRVFRTYHLYNKIYE